MMWDNIKVFILGLIVVALCLPFAGAPVYADGPKDKLKQGDRIILENGTEATYLGFYDGGHKFMTTIDAPSYVPGTTIPIDTNWYYYPGKGEWYSGDNLFDATVKGEKVTIEKDGQKMDWDPKVSVNGINQKAITSEAAVLSQDPVNENYYGNTLEWDYVVCKRHLRIIEGVEQDLYIVETNPGGDIEIKSNLYKDAGFMWDRPPFAYDANGMLIEIEVVGKDKIVRASEFDRMDITYPITIDPASTFVTSSSDGHIYLGHSVYNTARTTTSGDMVVADGVGLVFGQRFTGTNYVCYRGFVYFDTSGLPDGCEVDSATLNLWGLIDYSDTDFDMTIQTGTLPGYPADPLTPADYNYSRYTSDGGNLSTFGLSTSSYNSIVLNATGKDWISLTGGTNFPLRSSREIAGTTPTGNERVYVYAYEKGDGYWPQLVVTYSAAITPTVTTLAATDEAMYSAKQHAYLNDDGGAGCQMQWLYDVDSGPPYAFSTGWLGTNYTTGQTASTTLYGLNHTTTYYVIAQAQNDEGAINGTEISFTTLATLNPPTDFIGIPRSNSEVSFTFTKGIGSDRTYIMYKIGEYPGAPGDHTATFVCNITGGSYLLENLNPGVTLWVKSWGYDSGEFSATNTTEIVTTLAGIAPLSPAIDAPTIPSRFWAAPSLDKVSNLFIYDGMNRAADSMDMPRTTLWFVFAMGIAMAIGAAFYWATGEPMLALIGVGLGIGGGYEAWIVPWWVLLIYFIFAAGIMFVLVKRGGGA